jgi:hypothetical protein
MGNLFCIFHAFHGAVGCNPTLVAFSLVLRGNSRRAIALVLKCRAVNIALSMRKKPCIVCLRTVATVAATYRDFDDFVSRGANIWSPKGATFWQ